MFPNEEKCIQHLINVRWPDGFLCPGCHNSEYWKVGRRLRCKNCRCEISPTSGTIFHRSKKPLMLYFRALRYNRRNAKGRGLLFHRLIEQAVKHSPVAFNDILSSKTKH